MVIFFFFFLVANVRVRENRHGQIYDMGKPYPQVIRENILVHNNGLSIRQISAQARVSTGFIPLLESPLHCFGKMTVRD